jgi:hypothetical protein
LLDGLFSNQPSVSLHLEFFDIFNGQLVYFVTICFILWQFGVHIYYIYLVYIVYVEPIRYSIPNLVNCIKKNLATVGDRNIQAQVKMMTLEPRSCGIQGDKIGRIFAQGAITYIGQFYKNCRISQKFWATFFQSIHHEVHVLILTKNCLGYVWGNFIHKTVLVALVANDVLFKLSNTYVQLAHTSVNIKASR